MYHALQIPEVLLNTFSHCCRPTERSSASDLPALARTCRAFKEPALDILWEELVDSSPIARCLLEACSYSEAENRYSFTTELTQDQWNVLKNYTRRIRSILNYPDGLDMQSVRTFLDPPLHDPLVPNLRHLHAPSCTLSDIKRLLLVPPLCSSLISFNLSWVESGNMDPLQSIIDLFSGVTPNLRKLSIDSGPLFNILLDSSPRHVTFGIAFSRYICRWGNLQIVDCGRVALDADALAHLSRMPALTQLSCRLSAKLPSSNAPLLFSNLHALTVNSHSLDLISGLLSRSRLPTATTLHVFLDTLPSKDDLHSFWASIQTSNVGDIIRNLELGARRGYNEGSTLHFEDLRPCIAFGNIRRIGVRVSRFIELTDGELLQLASAWPYVEELLLNEYTSWGEHGVTPNGLVQVLQTCRSLNKIALAINTRNLTQFNELPAILEFPFPPVLCIDVLSSFIDTQTIPVMAAFFTCIARGSDLHLRACDSLIHRSYWALWNDVCKRANDALGQQDRVRITSSPR